MGLRDMGRPFDKHIDEQELQALASSFAYEDVANPSSASDREAEHHLSFCEECRSKVSRYRQMLHRTEVGTSPMDAPQPDCPKLIDWQEVADGLWPELETRQLITHASRCGHCGPLLRAAVSADEPTAQEEAFLAQLKAPSRPVNPAKTAMTVNPSPRNRSPRIWRRLMDWKILVPAAALFLVIAVLGTGQRSSGPVSGMEFAQFAARTHEQHLRGNFGLELNTDSQSMLNSWLHEKAPFSLALPVSSETAPGQLPYRIEGARVIQIRNKTAAYVAYQMQPQDVSLIVAPVSAALASGGVQAAFSKVTFHYYTIQDYKVVTWSVHGLTYALVSAEGNKTQRSCMVCHSSMRDRDLSHTPTPLSDRKSVSESFLQ